MSTSIETLAQTLQQFTDERGVIDTLYH